jgi:hypothetical protein
MFWLRVGMARFKKTAPVSFWLAFILLIGLILALGQIFNRENGLRIRVGLIASDGHTLSRMQYYAGADCDIIVYTDEWQMRLDVASHRLECAYVFHGPERLTGSAPITAYRSPWTVSSGVLDLIIAAAYIESLAGVFGEEALQAFLPHDGDIAGTIQEKTAAYLRDGVLMETVYIETGGQLPDNLSAPYRRLFHGLTGLFGLLLALLCGMGGQTEPALAGRLSAAGRSAGVYALVGMGIIFIIAGLFVNLTLIAGNILYPGVVLDWGRELHTGWAFSFAVAGLAMLLAHLVKTDGAGLTVFLIIAAGLLGGTVFDIREVWVAAANTRFLFPNYYYLEGQAGVLWLIGGLAAGVLYMRHLLRKFIY